MFLSFSLSLKNQLNKIKYFINNYLISVNHSISYSNKELLLNEEPLSSEQSCADVRLSPGHLSPLPKRLTVADSASAEDTLSAACRGRPWALRSNVWSTQDNSL